MTQSYVVIGAYGVVGEALCRRLVQGGARVLMAGRDARRLAHLATDVGGEAFALDATSTGEVEACLRRAVELFGSVEGVANCVGSLLLKPAHAITDQKALPLLWVRLQSRARGAAYCILCVPTAPSALKGVEPLFPG